MKNKQKTTLKKIEKESKTLAFSPFSENLTRMGYGARGVIYGAIGLLALNIALGVSGSLSDQQGAIASGHHQIGRVLLGIILIGLIGYSLWGLIRTIFDPLHKGKKLKGILERIGFFMSALVYAILIPPTYNFIFNTANAAQNGAQEIQLRNIVSTIFLFPLGKWIVGIIGVCVIAISFYQIYLGIRHSFDKQLKNYSLTAKQIKIVKYVGRFGTLGRAVVSFLIGLFFMFAAYHSNSKEIKGIDGILEIILHEQYGHWLLGIVALGLIAFGAYSIISAFWFKFKK